jgi:hypothetical protein
MTGGHQEVANEPAREMSVARPDNNTPVRGAALTLAVLAPVVAELLSGATRISTIFALVPEIMVWGCGALLIREVIRRKHLPWTAMLLMGLGLSIAEEFVIQQTSLAPLPWLGSAPIYGRALGVNWLYFLFMLGYESVWVVLVPVHLTEMIFWRAKRQPWLRTRGLIISSVLFVLGSYLAWYAWIKRARPKVFHVPAYHAPWITVTLGVLAIVALVLWALRLRLPQHGPFERKLPDPWLTGLFVFIAGCPWYALMSFVFAPYSQVSAIPFWVPMAVGTVWGVSVIYLFRRFTSSAGWSSWHCYASIFAAILLCMSAGFLGSSAWPRIDLVGKLILNIIAVALLIRLGRVHRQRLTTAS